MNQSSNIAITYFSKSSLALASTSSSWNPYSDSNSLEKLSVGAAASLGAATASLATTADFSSFLLSF